MKRDGKGANSTVASAIPNSRNILGERKSNKGLGHMSDLTTRKPPQWSGNRKLQVTRGRVKPEETYQKGAGADGKKGGRRLITMYFKVGRVKQKRGEMDGGEPVGGRTTYNIYLQQKEGKEAGGVEVLGDYTNFPKQGPWVGDERKKHSTKRLSIKMGKGKQRCRKFNLLRNTCKEGGGRGESSGVLIMWDNKRPIGESLEPKIRIAGGTEQVMAPARIGLKRKTNQGGGSPPSDTFYGWKGVKLLYKSGECGNYIWAKSQDKEA